MYIYIHFHFFIFRLSDYSKAFVVGLSSADLLQYSVQYTVRENASEYVDIPTYRYLLRILVNLIFHINFFFFRLSDYSKAFVVGLSSVILVQCTVRDNANKYVDILDIDLHPIGKGISIGLPQ